MIRYLRQRLAWKIFFSYLAVIIVGIIVLATAAEFVVPSAFNRHMAAMGQMMEGGMGMGMGMDLGDDLFTNFRTAVNEALTLAATAAFIAAVVVSIFVSRQVVSPVQAMMLASQRIAEGHYEERVAVSGNIEQNDLDELSQLALSFNRMTDRLQNTEAMRRQLIGDVAHELRTPLTAIKGSMEGLIDHVLPPTAETFQQIYQEADRLQRLVADLQELSRVEAGAFELNMKPLSVSDLVTATVERLNLQFGEKGVSLKVDIPEGLPPITVDEDRLSQVMLNLVGNALQYSPGGGVVLITAKQVGNQLQVQVQDQGIGIAPEHLNRVFTRFYRVDKSRSRVRGGSGIGLTIAKHLVEAHNGRIWAESPGIDQGSSFYFTIPIKA